MTSAAKGCDWMVCLGNLNCDDAVASLGFFLPEVLFSFSYPFPYLSDQQTLLSIHSVGLSLSTWLPWFERHVTMLGGNRVNLLPHWQNKAVQLYSTGIYSCAFSTAFAVCGEGGRRFQMLIHCQDGDVDALVVCKWDFRTSVPPGLTDNSLSPSLMPAQQKPIWGCNSWGFSMTVSQFFHGSYGVRLVGRKQAVISLTCSQGRPHGQPGFQPLISIWCRPGMSLHILAGADIQPEAQDAGGWDRRIVSSVLSELWVRLPLCP